MHSIEIPEIKTTMYLPSSLSECDERQYIAMCELIFWLQTGEINYFDLRVQAVYKLLNLQPSKKKLLRIDEECKWGNVYQISELIDDFFDTVDGQRVIRMDYAVNPMNKIKPLWKSYYGPEGAFSNVTFGEYVDGLRLFLQFSKTGDTKLLYLLAAVFYRRRKFIGKYNTGDIRKPYNSHLIEKTSKVLRYAPIGFIYGFYLYFASFQKFITGAVVPWGGKELDFSILFDSAGNDEEEAVPGIGMDGLAFSLAESGEFGNVESVRKTNLWEVLVRLYDLRKRDLDNKAKEKKSSK